ncbi:hypothetical protein GCM10022261_05940 [Brevibacterium daeguense]|uniref:HTH merR-type domain-containing protein n=1 Tax=Brevibacterium daeguense TaxID=909936 RepID=A0ABP8EGH1_9MICO|nr:MerR family transcriptional regulator [Brevibacterium daeguense]
MKLKELTERTEVSSATVKYWIREGILPPGRLRNTTTADYDEAHVERIALISTMRTELGHSIDVIRALTTRIDDPAVQLVSIMDHCQSLAIGLSSDTPGSAEHTPGSAEHAPGSTEHAPVEQRISEACTRLGWPDTASQARAALAQVLVQMDRYGMMPTTDSLIRYGHALGPLAADNVGDSRVRGTRDAVALGVLIGVTMQTRYLVAMNSLAHASASIVREASDDRAE